MLRRLQEIDPGLRLLDCAEGRSPGLDIGAELVNLRVLGLDKLSAFVYLFLHVMELLTALLQLVLEACDCPRVAVSDRELLS